MKIYRLERNGYGPFTQSTKATADAMGDRVMFKRGDNHLHFMYGVDDPEKIKSYFSSCYEELLAEGFRVEEYEVPKRRVRYSFTPGHEVAFHIGDTEEGQCMAYEGRFALA